MQGLYLQKTIKSSIFAPLNKQYNPHATKTLEPYTRILYLLNYIL